MSAQFKINLFKARAVATEWWRKSGETMESGGEMTNTVKTQRLLFGRNTKEMTENNGAEAMEVGPGGGGGRLNLSRQIRGETEGIDLISQSQSEVGAGSNRNTPFESSDCD